MYVFIFLVKVTEWPPIGKIAAHLAYNTLPVPHGKQLRSILSYKPSSSQVSFPGRLLVFNANFFHNRQMLHLYEQKRKNIFMSKSTYQ